MYSVLLDGNLVLGSTVGHNLGLVSGEGKISMTNTADGSFVFPGGFYDAFMNTTGSTVEYIGAGDLFPIKKYQNVNFIGNGIKNLPNVNLLVQGNLLINGGGSVLNNSNYSKNIVLKGDWTDNNANGYLPGYSINSFTGIQANKRLPLRTQRIFIVFL